MSEFTSELDTDGVAVITWDLPGRSMNVLTKAGAAELEALVDAALADAAVKGIVITSGKTDFAGGMDLAVLASVREEGGDAPARAVFDWLMEAHALWRKIERAGMDDRNKGGKPIACAINGTCAGIGTEIALACHRRIMTDRGHARIGLPEIKLGLFPGGGGTTRVSRMLGLLPSAPILMEGRLLDPGAARTSGLVDDVVPHDDLLTEARAWVLNATDADIVKPWDQKGFKFPGGAPYHPAGYMNFVGAVAQVHGTTKGVYPAAQAMLSAIYEGALVPFDTALKIEARWFTKVLLDPTSSAMIRSLFLNKQALEKGVNRPAAPPARVQRVGVLGAGMMGAGIAYVSANAGIDVVLLDQSLEAAEQGKRYSEGILDKGIKRRRVTPEKKDAVLGRIAVTTDYADLGDCDLIVEAVFEDPAIKADVTKAAEAAIAPDAIFATNTSTLPIGDLAKASTRPEHFIGIHFFSPVDKMMLVEIIKGEKTGTAAVAKAFDFVSQLRKTPIIVNDARFFYANRCIIPYINEGIRMVGEGVAPALIENAAKLLGFPVGPLQLVDETSIDLGVKIAKATKLAMGDAYPDGAVDEVLFWMAGQKRLGRKVKAGFYAYDEKGKRTNLWDGLAAQYPRAGDQPDLTEVQHRLIMIQTLEAVRALDEGVLTDIREGDVAAILGWGFAPWSGGPFSWLDRIGAGAAVEICDRLTAAHGDRFAAPDSLRRMASGNASFYSASDAAAA